MHFLPNLYTEILCLQNKSLLVIAWPIGLLVNPHLFFSKVSPSFIRFFGVQLAHVIGDAPSGGQILISAACYQEISNSLAEIAEKLPAKPDYEILLANL